MSTVAWLLPLAAVAPLAAAIACPLVGATTARRILASASVAVTAAIGVAALFATGQEPVLVTRLGGFPAPFAIGFVADTLAALMLVVFSTITLVCLAFAAVADEDRAPRYHAGALALLGAAAGATLTGDLFNLFVWIEVLLMASYVLMSLDGARPHVRAGTIYIATNILGSTVFLVGVGLVYATAGTVNLGALQGATADPAVGIGIVLVLVALAVKAGLVPVHAWLPNAYPVAPAGVRALFSGTLTKVGVVAMFRIVWVVFDGGSSIAPALLVIAAVTMVVGVLGALGRSSIRGILSFHMVSQMGYLMMALGLGSVAGLTAGIFFLAQYVAVKCSLFLIGGAVEAESGGDELERTGGLAGRRPWLGAVFIVVALSLAGVPPLSGFVAKLALVRAAFVDGGYWIGAVAIGVSLLTLLSMVKIWNGAFWGLPPVPENRTASEGGPYRARLIVAPAGALALVTIALGPGAQGLWSLAERGARGLVHAQAYVEALTR
jgi:multicomponent Na+:H+ antiporter subunit D